MSKKYDKINIVYLHGKNSFAKKSKNLYNNKWENRKFC